MATDINIYIYISLYLAASSWPRCRLQASQGKKGFGREILSFRGPSGGESLVYKASGGKFYASGGEISASGGKSLLRAEITLLRVGFPASGGLNAEINDLPSKWTSEV